MPFSDPSYSNNIIEGIKPCAGKGCRKAGTNSLEVMYIDKIGWFCDSCKTALLKDNLVAQGVIKITTQQRDEKWRPTFETAYTFLSKEIDSATGTGVQSNRPAADDTSFNPAKVDLHGKEGHT
jgi:hypothetical protein